MKNLDDEIEKIMHALDGIAPAEPKPFFYTRLKARMENAQTTMPPQIRWVLQPAYLFSGLAIILILNVVSVVNYSKIKNQTSTEQTFEGFVKEYGLNAN